MIYSEEQIDYIYRKFNAFMNAYMEAIAPEYVKYAISMFHIFIDKPLGPDILMQIYHELDFDRYIHSIYYDQVKFVKENFDITGNVLDIGSGFFPCFANVLASEQIKLQKGTVTFFDPKLAISKAKYPNMILKKEKFTGQCNIKNINLITGILPCEATELIIRTACENHIPFYIQLCECTHEFKSNVPSDRMRYFFNAMSASQAYICALAEDLIKKTNNGVLRITKIGDNGSPAIYNQK